MTAKTKCVPRPKKAATSMNRYIKNWFKLGHEWRMSLPKSKICLKDLETLRLLKPVEVISHQKPTHPFLIYHFEIDFLNREKNIWMESFIG